jgi:hypothetical protein
MKLPRYVNGFIDRHGKARFYFRRLGFKKVALPGLPWSPAFMETYQIALAGQPPAIGAARVLPGSIQALAISYYNSLEYLALKTSTQRVRRNIIEKFCRETDGKGPIKTSLTDYVSDSTIGRTDKHDDVIIVLDEKHMRSYL